MGILSVPQILDCARQQIKTAPQLQFALDRTGEVGEVGGRLRSAPLRQHSVAGR